jgi:hypothetical protein
MPILLKQVLNRNEAVRIGLSAGAVALGGALLALGLVHSASSSPAVLLAPAALAAGAIFLLRPQPLLWLVFVIVVLIEVNEVVFPQLASLLYSSVFKGLAPVYLVLLLLLAGMVLDVHRRGERLSGAGPLSWPLALLAGATLAGAATGHARGASIKAVYEPVVVLGHLVLLPLIVVNLVRGRLALKRWIVLLAALAVAKSLQGLFIVATGREEVAHGAAATFLEPTANWLVMLFLLGLLSCALQRVKLPLWIWGAAPLALADFVLSYRRSFWIGAVLAIAVLVIVGSGRRGRRVAIPTVAMALVLSHLGSGEVQSNPVLKRAASLNPTSLSANAEDRYRIDERRNVLANLKEQPMTGLGIAIPWSAPHPLSLEHEGGRLYVHFAVLWYWLNLGLLGLIAYVSVMLATLWTAIRVWRGHPEPLIRAGGLAMLGAVLGLLLAEFTASFTGVDPRFSIVYPVILGLLASAYRQARAAPRAGAVRGYQPDA